jgi:23S rRNA (uracil1939-C5)-methyltransferase
LRLTRRPKVFVSNADNWAIPRPIATVLLDPPRTGALEAARTIAEARPRQVVYVSCNPATLARDLAVLVDAGYSVQQLELFELFPQTSHVETVVRLERG